MFIFPEHIKALETGVHLFYDPMRTLESLFHEKCDAKPKQNANFLASCTLTKLVMLLRQVFGKDLLNELGFFHSRAGEIFSHKDCSNAGGCEFMKSKLYA